MEVNWMSSASKLSCRGVCCRAVLLKLVTQKHWHHVVTQQTRALQKPVLQGNCKMQQLGSGALLVGALQH